MNNLLSIAIIASGIYLAIVGYKGIQHKQLKLLPINRRKIITGEAAIREGKKILIVGTVILIIGIVFLFIPY